LRIIVALARKEGAAQIVQDDARFRLKCQRAVKRLNGFVDPTEGMECAAEIAVGFNMIGLDFDGAAL
jgi:hypothetical protein